MSSVLDRPGLEKSPLADLHLLAGELGVENYRRLRKADLIDAILSRQSGEEIGADVEENGDDAEEGRGRSRRGRRGGRSRVRSRDDDSAEDDASDADEPSDDEKEQADEKPRARSRGRGRDREGGRDRDAGRDRDRDRDADDNGEDKVAEGVVELLANGSGFVRLTHPEPSDDDVYVSPAQVRRCELMSGDRVSGPVRRPRRSERFPSLVRVDTINGAPAEEVAEGTPYDELRCAWPSERIALDGDEPTLKAIEWLTPIGRGSRVSITGGPRAGKSEALRRIAGALKGREELELSVVLAGVRPEEAAEWAADGPVEPVASLTLGAGSDAQAQAVERAIGTAKRVAARGGHAVVLIDSLDALAPVAARRALAAARAIVDGGTLTVIAVSTLPVGGETTVVALDAALAGAGGFPALDLAASGTLRPERLVGEEGARAIAGAHAEALGQRGT
jgi:transcription termination factor Rho